MKTYLQYGLYLCLLLGLIIGCRKDEYIPPPEGENIPYVDPQYKTLEEILKTSPYQLFLKAYQRSQMDSVLKNRSFHTLLVPTDAAMQTAGYTSAAITALTASEADSLVAFYTLRGSFTKEELQMASGNREGVTLLTNSDPNLRVVPYYYGNGTNNESYDSYYYRHYIIASGDNFLVNGQPVGSIKNALPASNGYIYVVDRPLPKPIERSFWQVLAADPRFSMFMEVQQKADELFDTRFRKVYEEATGWDPGGYGWIDGRRTDYKNAFDLVPSYDGSMTMRFSMLFAPTNEAFQKAGFATVDEVMAWNDKYASEPVFDFNTYEVSQFGFPSDSVFAFHWDFGRDNLPYSGIYGKAPDPKSTVFYSNDLRNEYLGSYLVNNRPSQVQYAMPFTFGLKADGRPTVQVKGSSAEPATVIETINTIMGPVQVVDRLLIPKDLKMN